MRTQRSMNRILAGGLIGCLLMIVAGCDDSGDDPEIKRLKVMFTENYFNGGSGWIVVHSLDGNSAVAAKRVNNDGLVDMDVPHSERVTFTVIRHETDDGAYPQTSIHAITYRDVPSGTFIEKGGDDENPAGQADITIIFPEGYYSELILSPDKYQLYHLAQDSLISSRHYLVRIYPDNLEDNGTLSIYSSIKGSESGYSGWLLNQPFIPGQINNYTLHLDQPLRTQTVSCSPPMPGVCLNGHRGASYTRFIIGADEVPGEGGVASTFDLIYGLIPVNRFSLSGWIIPNGSITPFRSVQIFSDSVPSSLTLSDISVSAFRISRTELGYITVSGRPDLFMATWNATGDNSIICWQMTADPHSTTVGLPALPDSILDYFRIETRDWEVSSYLIWDFEPAFGYDALVRRYYMDERPDAAKFSRMDAYAMWSVPGPINLECNSPSFERTLLGLQPTTDNRMNTTR